MRASREDLEREEEESQCPICTLPAGVQCAIHTF